MLSFHREKTIGIPSRLWYILMDIYSFPFHFAQALSIMDKKEFSSLRKALGKTQKQLASLLGMSLKTVHSYEQGWRAIPAHIERQLYFLLINQRGKNVDLKPCWEQKACNQKEECPAWEFQSGHLCWFLCGTLCECTSESSYREKISVCRTCPIFKSLTE